MLFLSKSICATIFFFLNSSMAILGDLMLYSLLYGYFNINLFQYL
ncbi:phospho-N-acetylmuramoyl-pentapeptide-transferase, partial [Helicobacter pylori]|nr:phospho-N-acetylmuramoyl-pentapeptide-transferase [Helicobacter pylori]